MWSNYCFGYYPYLKKSLVELNLALMGWYFGHALTHLVNSYCLVCGWKLVGRRILAFSGAQSYLWRPIKMEVRKAERYTVTYRFVLLLLYLTLRSALLLCRPLIMLRGRCDGGRCPVCHIWGVLLGVGSVHHHMLTVCGRVLQLWHGTLAELVLLLAQVLLHLRARFVVGGWRRGGVILAHLWEKGRRRWGYIGVQVIKRCGMVVCRSVWVVARFNHLWVL